MSLFDKKPDTTKVLIECDKKLYEDLKKKLKKDAKEKHTVKEFFEASAKKFLNEK